MSQNQKNPFGEIEEQKGDLISVANQETEEDDLIIVSPTEALLKSIKCSQLIKKYKNFLMNSPKTDMRIEKKAAVTTKKKRSVPPKKI